MIVLRFGMAAEERGTVDIDLMVRLMDQHIAVLTAKLQHLMTKDRSFPWSMMAIVQCKAELDQALDDRRSLRRHEDGASMHPTSFYYN